MKLRLALNLALGLLAPISSSYASASVDVADNSVFQFLAKKPLKKGRCFVQGTRYPQPGEGCRAEVAAFKALGYSGGYAFGYDGNGRMYCEMPETRVSCR